MSRLRQPTPARTPSRQSRGSQPGAPRRVRTFALAELQGPQLERWRELAARAVEPNPFFEPEFLLPLAAATPSARPELMVYGSDREWLAALPVRRAATWHRIPLPGTATWTTSYTFYGAPLLARESAAEGARALLGSAVRGRHYLGLDLLATDGPAAHALERAAAELGLRTTVLRSYERAALRRRPDPRQYLQLKPKHRRELRRLRDRLAETMQAPVEGHDESSSDAAIAEFLALEASGWKREAGTALAVVGGYGEMFRQVCHSFAERGRLQLLTLRAGDCVLAAKCNLLAGDGAFCFKIAFDEQYARFSPGVQLEVANIAHFHARPQLAWQDSCAEPGNEMINRLWPDRRPIALKAVTGDSASGRAAQRLFRAAARTRDLIKGGDDT